MLLSLTVRRESLSIVVSRMFNIVPVIGIAS